MKSALLEKWARCAGLTYRDLQRLFGVSAHVHKAHTIYIERKVIPLSDCLSRFYNYNYCYLKSVMNGLTQERCEQKDQVHEDNVVTRKNRDGGEATYALSENMKHSMLESDDEKDLDQPMEFSDLSDPTKHIWIVTTASLPWRTGTSINPFLRALYFVRRRLHLYTSGDIAGKVSLVIPWIDDMDDAMKLYGGVVTKKGDEGREQQIQWIKNYAINQCGMSDEIKHLNILFYDAEYWVSFGSIFPTVDICSLIPDDETDIAILEEPEHLNWFRAPSIEKPEDKLSKPSCCDGLEENAIKNPALSQKNDASTSDSADLELGWTHKFKYVVGIIHTNYTAYVKQYGMGTSIFGAPALQALSSMVVRAYCHKVIRLSGVIPHYAPWKEVTENVHGVRRDFLVPAIKDSTLVDDEYAPIYFIGKLLWAKGLDLLLKVQEIYRKNHGNGDYFQIDIYGDGPDRKDIQRAFLGRMASSGNGSLDSLPENTTLSRDITDAVDASDGYENEKSTVFVQEKSLKAQLKSLSKDMTEEEEIPDAYKDAQNYINMGFELVVPDDCDGLISDKVAIMERRKLISENEIDFSKKIDPLSILSDVSKRSFDTGIATTKAVRSLADKAIKSSFSLTFSSDMNEEDSWSKTSLRFDPPKSMYELRRNPLPARFLGVKDHAHLRDLPHKIFLNPSVTEVLCTTTAEALAMNKFVIIPIHPSNDFFLQFSNCLAYESLSECAEKIIWALENDPTPLSKEESRILTWEAATERLIKSSIILKRERRDRLLAGHDKTDSRMAWLHSQSGKKGIAIKQFLRKDGTTTN